MPIRHDYTEDEVNRMVRGPHDKPNGPLDAEANIKMRIRVGDLMDVLKQLDVAKEVIFPGTDTKVGISGIKKVNGRPVLIRSEVSFRGKTNTRASMVLESLLARYLR